MRGNATAIRPTLERGTLHRAGQRRRLDPPRPGCWRPAVIRVPARRSSRRDSRRAGAAPAFRRRAQAPRRPGAAGRLPFAGRCRDLHPGSMPAPMRGCRRAATGGTRRRRSAIVDAACLRRDERRDLENCAIATRPTRGSRCCTACATAVLRARVDGRASVAALTRLRPAWTCSSGNRVTGSRFDADELRHVVTVDTPAPTGGRCCSEASPRSAPVELSPRSRVSPPDRLHGARSSTASAVLPDDQRSSLRRETTPITSSQPQLARRGNTISLAGAPRRRCSLERTVPARQPAARRPRARWTALPRATASPPRPPGVADEPDRYRRRRHVQRVQFTAEQFGPATRRGVSTARRGRPACRARASGRRRPRSARRPAVPGPSPAAAVPGSRAPGASPTR